MVDYGFVSDPTVYIVTILISAVIASVVRRVKLSQRLAQFDASAQQHGFVPVKAVSIRVWGITVLRALRSYVREPLRIDLFFERDKDRPILERIGLGLPMQSIAISFPDERGFPDASVTRKHPLTYLGTSRKFSARFPALKNVDISTGDVDGVIAALTDESAMFLANMPGQVRQVWMRQGRIFFILRAPDFEALMFVIPTFESSIRAFSKER